MSDQCHSSVGLLPAKSERVAHERVGVSPTGAAFWRGLDDLRDTPEFREFLEREFQPGASELVGPAGRETRREFIKLMGAGLALAGLAGMPGCRRPDHKILAYSKDVPEDIVPGKSLYYASSVAFPGGAVEGVLVETHEGRPTKIEGNPQHPVNQGRSSVWAQSAVLDLYDPDRLKDPVFVSSAGERGATWDDFAAWSAGHFASFDATKGAGLAFLVDKQGGPTRDGLRERVLARWPSAKWVAYDALDNGSARAGTTAALGGPHHELLSLREAGVVVSLDRDFLGQTGGDPNHLVHARDFAASRRVLASRDAMSRLYCVESTYSATGAQADHRLRLAPSLIPAFAVALAKELFSKKRAAGTEEMARALLGFAADRLTLVDQGFVAAVAEDLLDTANLGRSVVVAGPTQPAGVHALCAAINALLGNVGKTVRYTAMRGDAASDSVGGISALAAEMNEGKIGTLVCMGVNPVFTAPADTEFEKGLAKVAHRIVWSVENSETVAKGTWRLNGAHWLESWGDTRAPDGTVAPTQPMIAPLYGGRSQIEALAMMLGETVVDGYELVRAEWKKALGGAAAGDFEKAWRRSLHNGIASGFAPAKSDAAVNVSGAAGAVAKIELSGGPTDAALDVVFTSGYVGDGRFANNAWLQELPDPASKIVWDNAALMSRGTAERLGVIPDKATKEKPHGRMVELRAPSGRSVRAVAWVMPGLPENTVNVALGYGRSVAGLVGDGVGFRVEGIRESRTQWAAAGVSVSRVEDGEAAHHVVTTQSHGSMEGRAIVREIDLAAWKKHADEPALNRTDAYGNSMEVNLAERLGELSHTPPNLNIYPHPSGQTRRLEARTGSDYARRPQWGMTIDLSTCTGCNVCTVACQAENNIAVVGKTEVNKGREMQWIRVDRYFAGDVDDPGVHFQPVACVQCENAPCETVCPVNATVHGPEGLNYMVYNRCIGTRYCANNCPYKVRRFNFFDYGVAKFNGSYVGKEALEKVIPDRGGITGSGEHNELNPNLIPPRLREKLDEITKLQKNPNVTVRSRGVMEKCSYCIQRINEARIEHKLSDKDSLPDGAVRTACQQACPSDAIVFGDIEDAVSNGERGSVVRQMRLNPRSYALLGFLNTRPRTTHLLRVRNPNPRLRAPVADPFDAHGGDGHGSGGEGHGEGGQGAEGAGEGHARGAGSEHGVDRARRRAVLHLPVLGARA